MGVWRRPTLGFNIGSGLAPGGASLLASFREKSFLADLDFHTRSLFRLLVLVMRWMDDLLLVTFRAPPVQLQGALSRLTDMWFYGKGLKLERARDLTPFGFQMRFPMDGGMLLRQDLKYREDFNSGK